MGCPVILTPQMEPSIEDIARWDRWFAIQMNNRAWDLADKPARTMAEDEEMLDAAHAAAAHWSRIGNDLNRARADLLLGHAHALLGHGSPAMLYARRGYAFVTARESPDWEMALAHAVLANAAHAAREATLHRTEYALAKSLADAIADPEDREIFERSFARIARP